jgi:hypothetical protein
MCILPEDPDTLAQAIVDLKANPLQRFRINGRRSALKYQSPLSVAERIYHSKVARDVLIMTQEEMVIPIRIRLADLNDVVGMTDLHCRSFKPEEHVPMALGKDYVQATYKWLVTSNQSYALIAENGSSVVGLVAVCDRSFTFTMFVACLPQFMISMIENPALLFNIKLWKRLFRRPDVVNSVSKQIVNTPGVSQMTIGAVDGSFRGQNIFPKLISSTKIYSKQRGSRAIRAGVYNWNKSCIRAFEKDGWIKVPELSTTDTLFFMRFLDETIASDLGLDNLT